ncbi:MAG: hypothetical protein DCF22_07485 [Leptolyngbya sp.]|nr:MAG: hypothetical protein DCF22_07485 [Leptolyngbya sp.]
MESQLLSIEYLKQQPRWDFRYFDPKYLEVENLLHRGKYPLEPLEKFARQIQNFGAYSLCNLLKWVDDDDAIPYLKITNLKEDGIDWSDVLKITPKVHDQLPKSKVYPDDILYSMAGTIGLAVLAPENLGECNSNQAIAKIRLKPDTLNSGFLVAFLNSRLGRYQSERIANGQTVLNINLGEIGKLLVPVPPRSLQDQIAQVMQEAYGDRQKKLEEAKQSYQKIINYVFEELGINLTASQRKRNALVPISLLQGGRFDFEAVVTLQDISAQFTEHETTLLKEIVQQTNERITPSIDSPGENVNYIGLANIQSNSGELVNFEPVRGEEILSASPKFKEGDILFGRMRPYLNKVWIAEFDGICSGEALVFRPNQDKVDTQFLQALLLSQLTLDQVVPLQSGSSLPRVSSSDVLNIKLPVPKDLQKQKEIGSEVEKRRSEAKRLRSQAEAVVAAAKARVERMILGEEETSEK